MKVYGFTGTPGPTWDASTRQVRIIVAAKSWAAAGRALRDAGLNVSDHYLRNYGSETGNDVELALAQPNPGVVFFSSETRPREFRRVDVGEK